MNLPSCTIKINIGKLLEYLAGPFSVAREWPKTDLNDDIPLGREGRCEIREATEIVDCTEEGSTPSAEPRN